MKGWEGKGREGTEGRERVGKWEGGLDFDICAGAHEYLVTPLSLTLEIRTKSSVTKYLCKIDRPVVTVETRARFNALNVTLNMS